MKTKEYFVCAHYSWGDYQESVNDVKSKKEAVCKVLDFLEYLGYFYPDSIECKIIKK